MAHIFLYLANPPKFSAYNYTIPPKYNYNISTIPPPQFTFSKFLKRLVNAKKMWPFDN